MNIICIGAYDQQSYYVSARGNNINDGLSEASSLKSLSFAVRRAIENGIYTVTVIGTLDKLSEQPNISTASVFSLLTRSNRELLITGKKNAAGPDRAVLSALGSNRSVLGVANSLSLRIENIEISGGENVSDEIRTGAGIIIRQGATVTLGVGAIVKNNENYGAMFDGKLIIDGGEISNHYGEFAVFIQENGVLTMHNGLIKNNYTTKFNIMIAPGGSFVMHGGSISNNKIPHAGGGVYIFENGNFIMSGGSINNNNAGDRYGGGGVFVMNDGIFTITGGSINNNTAAAGGGVYVSNNGRFYLTGGTISHNIATRGSDHNILRE